MREIKFRGKRKNGPEILIGDLVRICNGGPCIFPSDDTLGLNSPDYYEIDPATMGQFTGKKDKDGTEIFEGDIFRIEESGDGDVEDQMFYVVIVWIQEWCTFGSLLLASEYQNYLAHGVEALDEPMFWTYTLEDTDSLKHFLCGNIHQNPELL